MTSTFRQVALIGKYQTASAAGTGSRSRPALADIAALLQAQGCTVVLEEQTASNAGLNDYATEDLEAIGRQCDLGLVVGGDGTMLGIGRKLASSGVPLIGINHGRLGFMTDIPFGSFETVLPPMLRGEYEEERRQLMRARVLRQGECVFDTLAMNDVVVHRGNTSGMVELRVEVDGHFVANQRADGLIVATPTGSTAYSLSAGGPILHPSIPGWVMAPIAPHTLSNRPVVLSSDSEVAIEIASDREAIANFDMQSLAALQQGDRIIVSRSEHSVRFLHPRGWSYFDTLRQKLHWNEGITGP
ncbi:MAG: NAD kinase [Hylemonella sp.]|uniref:NAD kinase n=1 Tax=Hylemonella sp. TaxID=2066020 RepID=UPI0022C99716|nr:NAD kinase [Hylemonella sp.]MCZ8252376.1 NAD kinase [Hylemonella sp.]